EVAQRLGHLLSVDTQMLGVQPEAGEGSPCQRFRLGDFIFVMGKRQVYAAGVDVQGLAQILHRHDGAFDMPAGPAGSERRLPGWFAVLARLPENEVAGVRFVVFVYVDARSGADPGEVVMRELAVVRE